MASTINRRHWDLNRHFGRAAPLTLEIGFGNGEHLLERALGAPDRDFLGVEVHQPGIGHLLLSAATAEVTNLRVIAHDAVEVLANQIAPASLDEVQLLYPNPWPEKASSQATHRTTRIRQADCAPPGSCGTLAPGDGLGTVREQMLEVLNACPGLANCAADGGYADPEDVTSRRATRFQRRAERLGHALYELLYRRI